MVFYAEAYLSDLLKVTVLDRDREPVGQVKDIAVRPGDTFPLVTRLIVRPRGRREALPLPWSVVRSVSAEAIVLSLPKSDLKPSPVEKDEILLVESVLDKQIVDVQGRRVVKVNDLKLGSVGGQLRLLAAGVGTRSLLRRLNLEGPALRIWSWFGRRPHDRLISWEHVHALDPTSQQLHLDLELEKLRRLNPADLADILGELSAPDRAKMVSSLDDETAAAAMQEMDLHLQRELLDAVDDEKAADILDEIAPDDAADLVGDLPKERADELLALMEPEEARDVKELLRYSGDSAGGLMTPDLISVPSGMTAQEAIGYLRKAAEDAETIYYCYVLDEQNRLIGVFSLKELIVAPPTKVIDEFMERDVVTVTPDTSLEETAALITRYNLLAIPVVDEEQHILGIVTVDDVIDAVLPARWKKSLPRVF